MLPIFTLAQKGKGYASASFNLDFPKNTEPAIGLTLSGNAAVGKGGYVGASIGLIMFKNNDGPYIPFCLRFTGIPNTNEKQFSPLVIFEPGYGIYSNSQKVGNITINSGGGFTFIGLVGISFPKVKKARPYLAAGYGNYGFTINTISDQIETFAVRAGIMFF